MTQNYMLSFSRLFRQQIDSDPFSSGMSYSENSHGKANPPNLCLRWHCMSVTSHVMNYLG